MHNGNSVDFLVVILNIELAQSHVYHENFRSHIGRGYPYIGRSRILNRFSKTPVQISFQLLPKDYSLFVRS